MFIIFRSILRDRCEWVWNEPVWERSDLSTRCRQFVHVRVSAWLHGIIVSGEDIYHRLHCVIVRPHEYVQVCGVCMRDTGCLRLSACVRACRCVWPVSCWWSYCYRSWNLGRDAKKYEEILAIVFFSWLLGIHNDEQNISIKCKCHKAAKIGKVLPYVYLGDKHWRLWDEQLYKRSFMWRWGQWVRLSLFGRIHREILRG